MGGQGSGRGGMPPELFDRVLADLLAGRPTREISAAHGVDPTTVRKIRRGVHHLQRQKPGYLRHVLPLAEDLARLAEESETRQLTRAEEDRLTAAIEAAADRVFQAKSLDAAGSS